MIGNPKLSEAVIYKDHKECRVCGSERLIPYLDLGQLPLSNNLAESATDPIHDQRYPLKVLLCEKCGLSQLSIVIPPETLFGHYVYRSGISSGYVQHCKEMALQLKSLYNLNQNTFHIDIAGNDGTLLKQFRSILNHRALNIDPAKNLVPLSGNGAAGTDEYGIRYYTEFWGLKAAKHLRSTYWPLADLITATNVIAHVDNVKEFLEAVRMTLKPTGVLVLEMPYLIDFIEKHEFDQVYFEHLSIITVYPITLICEKLGLTVMSVEHKEIHGGSIRVTIGYNKQDKSVSEYVMNERDNFSDINVYYKFAEDVHIIISNFRELMLSIKGKVVGFAASAKGNTLLNCAGIERTEMAYIVDDTPEKQGKYSPGTRIPIYPVTQLLQDQPEYVVLLSWNFAEACIERCRKTGYKGKYILPLTLEIID